MCIHIEGRTCESSNGIIQDQEVLGLVLFTRKHEVAQDGLKVGHEQQLRIFLQRSKRRARSLLHLSRLAAE